MESVLIAADLEFKGLTSREKEVMKLRLGFTPDGIVYSRKEVARIFKITVARATQIEESAAKKLNRYDKAMDEPTDREKRLEAALKHATRIILSYQTDLRNSDGVCGITGNLADAGFCQGSIYRNAIADINKMAGEEIYPA